MTLETMPKPGEEEPKSEIEKPKPASHGVMEEGLQNIAKLTHKEVQEQISHITEDLKPKTYAEEIAQRLDKRSEWMSHLANSNPEDISAEDYGKVKRYVLELGNSKNVKQVSNITRLMEQAEFLSNPESAKKNPEQFKKAGEAFAIYYKHLAEKESAKAGGEAPLPMKEKLQEQFHRVEKVEQRPVESIPVSIKPAKKSWWKFWSK
ncbi:hypothetical protein KW782_01555 [Candidatus Parcubacteria bacterium]|nr:hypothetical protein [Candidatus Parcubacteria bacterium]